MLALDVSDAEKYGGILCIERFKLTMHPLVLLVEQSETTTPFPKMEYVNGRSMELLRHLKG